MGRCRVVAPEVERLPLSDGDFIVVKRYLNAGETRKMIADQFKDTPLGERPVINHEKAGLSKLLAYIVSWSLAGIDNKPLNYEIAAPESVRIALLDMLDPDTFRELKDAVDAHEERMDQELEARKNAQATGSKSSPTSSSLEPLVGATSGSPNSR